MPTVKEFTIHMEDRPGTLAKLCRTLADNGVNIVAFQSVPGKKGQSAVRMVTNNPTTTKTVLGSERTKHTETLVAQTKLPHRPGALGEAAAKLWDNQININYAYGGIEPVSNAPVVIFGVAEVNRAAKILDEAAAAVA